MSDWYYSDISQVTSDSEKAAKNTAKILTVLETMSQSFNQAHEKIDKLEQEVSDLHQEISDLKQPKKTTISFSKQKAR